MTFKDNLHREMKRADMSQYKLAKLSGVSQPTIQRALKGSQPQAETIKKLAKALGVASSVLIDDAKNNVYYQSGTPLAVSESDAVMRHDSDTQLWRVPVFTEKDVLERKKAQDVISTAETVATDTDVTSNAFGWKIQSSELGDLNMPFATPVMAILIVEPNIKPKNGDWILITDAEQTISVRRLEIDGPHYYLHSLRSKHEPIKLDESYLINGVIVSINLKTR